MNKKYKYIFIVLLISISIGFAYLSTNLSILGNVGVKSNSWNVYLNNVVVGEGSVAATKPVISNDKLGVSATINLHEPGDYYSFSVDAVNAGTIDAMIESINKTEFTESQKKYLDLSIRYTDNIPVGVNYLLRTGDTKTFYIKLEYKEDVEVSDLPIDGVNGLSINIDFNYVQASDEIINSDSITFVLHKNGINPLTGLEENVINFYDNSSNNQGNIVDVDTISIEIDKSVFENLPTNELYANIMEQYDDINRFSLNENINPDIDDCNSKYVFYWKYSNQIGFVGGLMFPTKPYRFLNDYNDFSGRLDSFSDLSNLFSVLQSLGLHDTVDLY